MTCKFFSSIWFVKPIFFVLKWNEKPELFTNSLMSKIKQKVGWWFIFRHYIVNKLKIDVQELKIGKQ